MGTPAWLVPLLMRWTAPTRRHRDLPYCRCCYKAAYVSLWLEADIRWPTLRGPVSAPKQTLATWNSERRRFMSAYRSKADVGDEVARRLLMTQNSH